jgi:hypothetical protein
MRLQTHGFSNLAMGFSNQAKYTNKLSAILSLILPQNGYGRASALQSISFLLG